MRVRRWSKFMNASLEGGGFEGDRELATGIRSAPHTKYPRATAVQCRARRRLRVFTEEGIGMATTGSHIGRVLHIGIAAILMAPVAFSGATAAPSRQPRLTQIRGSTVNQCRWSLDERGSVVVAYQGQGNAWRMGINGQTIIFAFKDFTYDPVSAANIFRTRDRKIFVRATPVRAIRTLQHDVDVMSITVVIGSATTTTIGYRACPAGD